MKLHTRLDSHQIHMAMADARRAGKITNDVHFVVFEYHASKSHANAYEIQLGTTDKNSLPDGTVDQYGKRMRVRRYKNSGQYGAESVWSATYFEWGWFMLEVFKRDPNAAFGSATGKHGYGYQGIDDFHEKTKYAFLESTK